MPSNKPSLQKTIRELDAIIQEHLATIDPAERDRRHKAAMNYAAKAFRGRNSKVRRPEQILASRRVSRTA